MRVMFNGKKDLLGQLLLPFLPAIALVITAVLITSSIFRIIILLLLIVVLSVNLYRLKKKAKSK